MKIKELEFKIAELANKIVAPIDLLPQINQSNDFAKPYIDVGNGDVIYYVIKERGVEYERVLYVNEDELLYRIFKDITIEMAQKYELRNRIESQDFRILLFKGQGELMNLLNPDWGIRIKSENDKYLL